MAAAIFNLSVECGCEDAVWDGDLHTPSSCGGRQQSRDPTLPYESY